MSGHSMFGPATNSEIAPKLRLKGVGRGGGGGPLHVQLDKVTQNSPPICAATVEVDRAVIQ
jgi:hypothetical protein